MNATTLIIYLVVLKVLAMLTMAVATALASALLLTNSADRANTGHTHHCPHSGYIMANRFGIY